VDRSKLRIDHPGYDHRFAREDINVNLPFDRLKELVANGTIGSLSEETLVLMGLQPNVAPLIESTIPEIVAVFEADGVEAALLVPS
jgi:D-proline reductase (dithiol) PrdB